MTIPNHVPVGSGGAYANTAPYVGKAGQWHAVRNAWVGNGGSWEQFFQAIGAVTVSGQDASGYSGIFGSGTYTVSTSGGGCIPANGSGSYTYVWSYQSGDSGIAINNAAVQNPTWSKQMSVGDLGDTTASAVWGVTVTDSVTGETASTTITVSLELQSVND